MTIQKYIKKLLLIIITLCLLIVSPAIPADAKDKGFLVQQAVITLNTNQVTPVYTVPDLYTSPITVIAAGLPLQCTGITENGFFEVNIGGTYYVPGNYFTGKNSMLTYYVGSTVKVSANGKRTAQPYGMVIVTNDYGYDMEVNQASCPVLVYFVSGDNVEFKIIDYFAGEIAREHPKYKIVRVNIDRSPGLKKIFGISDTPTFMYFKNGKLMCRECGLKDKDALLAYFKL